MNRFDKIYGCLASLAIGDALGMPTEFLTPEQIHVEFGWVDSFVSAPAWHPHSQLHPGHVTDDTGQALAVLHAYTHDGLLTAKAVTYELLKWAASEGDVLPLITGPSTSQALELLKQGMDPRESGKHGKSNGAAFRAIPVGLVNQGMSSRLSDQVVEACLPTHGTSVAISGATAVAYAIAAACQEDASLESILEAARQGAVVGRTCGQWAWGTLLEKRIDLAVELVDRSQDQEGALASLYSYVGTDMLVAESVATAFGLVYLADGDPMKAMTYGANIGGDTDTIAAIAGAICGAFQGINAVDAGLLAQVDSVNALNLAEEARFAEAISRKVS